MILTRIAVLGASHNRKEVTLASLQQLFSQRAVEQIQLTVLLVDDGSKDGTGDAVKSEFPQVRLLHGDGSLYWNGGMRMAFSLAMQEGYDAYLWWNDDSLLFSDSLSRIVAFAEAEAKKNAPAIIVGSMCDPETNKRTYGGFSKRENGLHYRLEPVNPHDDCAVRCETMNGNFTLIPRSIAEHLGNLDCAFRHQLGDLDYGLRATREGIPILVAPGYYGSCPDNSARGTWRDRSLPRRKRWEHLMSPKGAPIREWLTFTYRHYGWRWLLYALSPYVKVLLG